MQNRNKIFNTNIQVYDMEPDPKHCNKPTLRILALPSLPMTTSHLQSTVSKTNVMKLIRLKLSPL